MEKQKKKITMTMCQNDKYDRHTSAMEIFRVIYHSCRQHCKTGQVCFQWPLTSLAACLNHPWRTWCPYTDPPDWYSSSFLGSVLVSNSPSVAHSWKSQGIYLACIAFLQPLTSQELLTQERHVLFPVGRCISNPHVIPVSWFTHNLNNSVSFAFQIWRKIIDL